MAIAREAEPDGEPPDLPARAAALVNTPPTAMPMPFSDVLTLARALDKPALALIYQRYAPLIYRCDAARARELLRQRQSFIWNATNITFTLRAALIELFTAYHARVRIVYVEAPWGVLLCRNRERTERVPEAVITRMLRAGGAGPHRGASRGVALAGAKRACPAPRAIDSRRPLSASGAIVPGGGRCSCGGAFPWHVSWRPGDEHDDTRPDADRGGGCLPGDRPLG